MLIDKYYETGSLDQKYIDFVIEEIGKAENRITNVGFFKGIPDFNGQLYDNRSEIPTQEYAAFVLEYDKEKRMALVEQRNYLVVNDQVEVFGPNLTSKYMQIEKMIDYDTNEEFEIARHPLQKFWINMPFEVSYADLIRVIKK